MNHSLKLASLFLLVLMSLLSGCATYSDGFKAVEKQILKQDYPAALALLEKQQTNGRDKVLYLMNRGMLLRMSGEFAQSNEAFEQAKQLAEELQAVSITEQAGATTVNDSMRSYVGDDYERIMLYSYKALNYLELGDPDAARVEILQMDVKANEIGKNKFTDSGFANYFSGLIYEKLGETDNALISYRKALSAYQKDAKDFGLPVPDNLKADLLRLTNWVGLNNEHEEYLAQFGDVDWLKQEQYRRKGEVVFLLHTGLAPLKGEKSSHAQHITSGRMVRVSLPYYPAKRVTVQGARIKTEQESHEVDLMEDVQGKAVAFLAHEMPTITARAVGRAMIKYAASKQAEERLGGLAGLAVNIGAVVSERADTRSWTTLPQRIYFQRLAMEPGSYKFGIEFLDAHNSILSQRDLDALELRAGRTIFRNIHWVSAN